MQHKIFQNFGLPSAFGTRVYFAKKISRKLKHSYIVSTMLVLSLTAQSVPFAALAAPASADLDQCRNGTSASPSNWLDSNLVTGGWVNGNAGSSNAHYIEGYSIPYRLVLTNLSSGAHTVKIEWDIKHSGKHAIDFITHYNRLEPHSIFGHSAETIDPTSGISGLGAPSTFAIPAPSSVGSPVTGEPTAAFNALPAAERNMTVWNGSITGMSYVSQGSLTASQDETQLQIDFTTSSSTVLLAWGGHIASPVTWGAGNSAGGISGSPYHTRLIDLDGSGGNQDRSLSANAVLAGELTVVKNVINDNGGTAVASDFTINVSGVDASPTSFPGSGLGTPVQLKPGAYSVTESAYTGYTVSYSTDCSGTISAGEQKLCIVTNNDNAPTTGTLTVNKVVINDNGGNAQVSDFSLFVDEIQVTSGTPNTLNADSYVVSETNLAGYVGVISGYCYANGNVTLGVGDNKTCTITNDDIAPSLTLLKEVNGGIASASDWTLTATGPTSISGTSGVTSDSTFSAGTYTLSESIGPSYYVLSGWSCDGGTQNGDQVAIPLDENVTCTATNTFAPPAPSLTLVKVVITDNGGTASVSDWTLYADDGPTPISGAGGATSDNTFEPGTYTLSESGGPDGYSSSNWVCVGGSQNGDDITLDWGDSVVCTITNNDIQPHLLVTKIVINDNGGTKVVSDFPLFVDNTPVTSGDLNGFDAGPYTVSETEDAGYTATISGDCLANGTITLALGDLKSCVITNDDKSGTYSVVEDSAPNYTPAYNNCSGVNIPNGGSATCTITNTLVDVCPNLEGPQETVPDGYVLIEGQCVVPPPTQGSLTVYKVVINDNGGTKTISQFSLFVNETQVTSGQTLTLDPATYVVSETLDSGYAVSFSGDCDNQGNVIVVAGQDYTCTITNNDIAPKLTVTKVVINDNGGTKIVSDFPLYVGETQVTSGAQNTFSAGAYVVSETNQSGYTAAVSGDCDSSGNITLGLADVKSCTITNNDIAPPYSPPNPPYSPPSPPPQPPPAPLAPVLTIAKSILESFTTPNGTLNYTVVVTNLGPGVASNVVLTDTLPAGFTYVVPTGATTQTWNLRNMAVGASQTITYAVLVGPNVASGVYTNTASVNAANFATITDDANVEVRQPQVLGFSTLPNTGGATQSGLFGGMILAISLMLMIVLASSGAVVVVARKRKNTKN